MKYTQSFSRYEKKYLLNSRQFSEFQKAAERIIRPDSYGQHTICSIYLDTENDLFIRNSIEKPVYKEKLRIRGYGVPSENSNVFFEIKKKFDGIVYKRRISAKEHDIEEYAASGVPSEALTETADPQIFSEIDYIMRTYRPFPRVFIAYDRRAYEGIADPSLRITFDGNIRSRFDDLRLSAGDRGEKLKVRLTDENRNVYYDENYRLMEIKTSGAIPKELAEILSVLKIYPSSFSKYGEIYRQSMIKVTEKYPKGALQSV